MLITSSTQWTIPLIKSINTSNPISSASPAPPPVIKHGSVLGLKTCQLSGPSILDKKDLHSASSSRRLQALPADPKCRSAGIRRQLGEDFFGAKPHDYDSNDWPAQLNNHDYDAHYDGIAMPWCTHEFTVDSNNAKVAGIDGEITAADVDLLPLPDLMSYPSHFYDSYFPSFSPTNSKISEVSSPESSANSSKSTKMVPNHLGLPPNFHLEVDGVAAKFGDLANNSHVNTPMKPPASGEQAKFICSGAKFGSNHASLAATNTSSMPILCVEDNYNFADSTAGLWTNPVINCNPGLMMHDPESLASIFNVLPQTFHELPSSTGPESDVENCNVGSQFLMDDLHYLVNSSRGASDETSKASGPLQPYVSPANGAFEVMKNGRHMLWEAQEPCGPVVTSSIAILNGGLHTNVGKQVSSEISELKSSHGLNVADASILPTTNPSETRFNGGMYTSSSLPIKVEKNFLMERKCNLIGNKRPFSIFQLPGIVSSSTTSVISGTNARHYQPDCMGLIVPKEQEMSHSCATQGLSAMLYKAQRGGKLAGLEYYMATEDGSASLDEEIMLKPPPAKVRRRHGTAMDPQSVAARSRREKFSDRIRILQSLVPNGERLDTVSMLGQTLEYVRFLQHQVWQLYHGMDPASPNNTCEKWKDFVEAEPALMN